MKTNFKILVVCFYMLSTLISFSQNIKWNNAPQKGFVFEITNKEAQKLLKAKTNDTIFNGLLHTQVDTFDVEKGWINRPSKGHFILAKIIGNKLHCEYTSVFPYQVLLFKEYDALSLQVLDLNGNVRDDAKVKLRFKRLHLDSESKTYRLENNWINAENQIATVELDGFRSIFNIEKHEVPEWYQNYYDNDNGPDFYSYMVTDKNKYKPNEHVRFKSYALSGSKSPIKKELEIWLTDYQKTTMVGKISPHRPGSFAGEFHLHDSLKMVLDKNYYLQLREKNGRIVASCSFRYEDYELFGNKLDIKLDTYQQFFPDKNEITISATDVNGLVLKDAKASIIVKTGNIIESFQPLIILPDTLLFSQIDLDPEKPTSFDIPSDIFQKSNTSYLVTVVVTNSENKRMEQTVSAVHFYSQYELTTRLSNDSICFELLNNGDIMDNVPCSIRYNNNIDSNEIFLPYKEKLNPALSVIHLKNKMVSKSITMSHLNPKLEILGGIVKDSFNISLNNPQKLDISWYVYQGSMLLKKGFGKEIDFKSIIENRTLTYYVEILYSFGGQDHIKRFQYPFKEEFLDVTLNIPERIYPGQIVDATIQVNNQLGEPVRNVDLTALAVTGKLNYYLPDLPYYGTSSSPRPKRASYSKYDINKRSAVLNLDYKRWVNPLRLDTMKYYQFTYPGNKAFVYKAEITDSTQFSVYVMQNGMAEQVYVIEVDRRPVYYSWVNQPHEYSFYISPGKKHEISLRLFDRVLVLDSLAFEAGKKTILSFDLDRLPGTIKVIKLGDKFTSTESGRHSPLVSTISDIHGTYAWLETDKEFLPVYNYFSSNYSFGSHIKIGPLTPGKKTYVGNNAYRITYQHSGGFNYTFEDNIVYKQNSSKLLPEKLTDASFNPMSNVNDLVMTKQRFLERKDSPGFIWHPGVIDISMPDSRFKILLPYEKEASGIDNLLFENCLTKQIVSPCFDNYNSNRLDFLTLPTGWHNLIVLYNNGTYLRTDSINMYKNSTTLIDLNFTALHKADSLSSEWLYNYSYRATDCYRYTNTVQNFSKASYIILQNTTGNLVGTIYDESNSPLPGACIIIKGTQTGVISDIDGRFSLQIDDNTATIIISFVGFLTEEIEVSRGSDISITLTPDVMALDEIVVVGYGTMRKSDLTGSVSSVNSESLEAPDDQIEENKPEDELIRDAEQRLYQELLTLKSIRSNFSDVGFWEPRLFTDKNGESKFTVTFPDDITRWDAVVYAMNRNLQTGTARKSIKSYKPLMGELHVPQFLTRGDSANFLGKVLNYTSDSIISGKVNWSGANTDFELNIQFGQYYVNKLPVYANSIDSITSRYVFTRNDGYTDGEERTVPVIEQGTVRAEGTLSILQNNDSLTLKSPENTTLTVEILSNQVEIYAEEVVYLLNYRFDCNEQLASKLIGLINYKLLMQYEGKPFKYNRDVNKIIDRLLKNQNKEFLWSWWNVSSNTSYWMSSHILRALKCAKDAGYEVNLNIENIVSKATYKFDFLKYYSLYDIDLIHALAGWGAKIDYSKYLYVMDSLIAENEYYIDAFGRKYSYRYSLLKEKLLLMEIRQITGLKYQRDTLLKFRKEGIMGDIYFSDDKPVSYWYNDNMASNVIAYRIAKNDSTLRNLCVPMQLYFLGERKKSGWNTYQSSNVIMNILPDLLAEGFSKGHTASVSLSGKENKTVTEFPYKLELQSYEEIKVKKETGLPLYFMQYYNERVTEAKTGVEGFKINTEFSTKTNILKAGEPVALRVEVEVTKDASLENVMIDVPIPGACSYADKRQMNNDIETHREYFKERTVIFCENMKPGKYVFLVHLLPRFTGKYILNPAQVSLMYVPVVNANTELKFVKVNEAK